MLHTRIFRRLALAAGTVILGLAAACGESTGPGDTAVTAVALSDTAVTLRMGDAVALVARTREAGGTDLVGRRVFWSTADTGVATVSQTGLVRAVAVGTTQVAASVEGRAATARVTVLARPVASLQLEPASLQLVVGARQRLTARALNDAGAVVAAAVTWTSETPATVTVTPDGEVTAVAPGVGTVRATADGIAASATVVVARVPVAGVTITPAAPSLLVGATQQLTATPTDAGGATLTGRDVAWSSRDPGVAVVSSTGQVTGIAPGTATIVASAEGRSATATVTVRPVPVAAVRVTPDNSTVGVGGTVRLGAVVTDAAGNALPGRSVAWTSSAPGVARVASDGTVTGVAPGTATLTATSEGVTGSATVRVTAAAASTVAAVEVAPAAATLTVGATRAFTATARAGDGTVLSGRTVTWSSGGPTVATVSSSGVVTAVAPGTAQILAVVDGITGTATVTVRGVAVASVQISAPATTVPAGASIQLTAQTRDASGNVLTGRAVTWTSSDASVLTVDNDGRVTGVSRGQAEVRVTSEGVTSAVAITVTAVVRVSPTSATLRDRGNVADRDVVLTATDHTGRILTATEVTWATSDRAIAEVTVLADGTARVRGVSSGAGTATATITATYQGATASAVITVTRN